LNARARRLAEGLAARVSGLDAEVRRGSGEVGGGALPLQRLEGPVVSISVRGRSADELESRAREAEPPVIGYIRGDRLRLDVRTLTDDEVAEAVEALGRAWTDER
jgi:L-seryl-tRNA(Ser) seleniumtransferase